MGIVDCDHPNARFSVSTWRTEEADESQTCFTQLAEAQTEFTRLRDSGNFRLGGLYRWVDDRICWGAPLDSWPDDYDEYIE